jgi:hypothetical protein
VLQELLLEELLFTQLLPQHEELLEEEVVQAAARDCDNQSRRCWRNPAAAVFSLNAKTIVWM